jgi:hypothetical protein
MAEESTTPDKARTKYPWFSFVLSLGLLAFLASALFLRDFNRLTLLSLFLPIPMLSIIALYFGERTFFPVHADQRMKNLTPALRRNLQIARISLFWSWILGMALYIAITAFSTHSGFLFQMMGFCGLALSSTIADLLAEPLFKPRPPIEPLNLNI